MLLFDIGDLNFGKRLISAWRPYWKIWNEEDVDQLTTIDLESLEQNSVDSLNLR